MSRSYYKPRDPGSLKSAEAELVKAAGGHAAQCRLGRTALNDCTDGDKPDRHLPADVILELERAAGNPILTRHLAVEQGYLLIDATPTRVEPYPLVLARVTTEMGELMSASAQAVHSGTATPAQARLMKKEAMELAAAVAAYIQDCDAIEAEEAKKCS